MVGISNISNMINQFLDIIPTTPIAKTSEYWFCGLWLVLVLYFNNSKLQIDSMPVLVLTKQTSAVRTYLITIINLTSYLKGNI